MNEQERKNIDVDIDDTIDKKDPVTCDPNIDLTINMLNNNKIDQKKKQDQNVKQAKKNQAEKEKAERIAKNKAMRKLHKNLAKNFLFAICLLSTISSTSVIGFFIWVTAKPNEWIFSGIVTLIGMTITLIHTYLYRYIREEIYRK